MINDVKVKQIKVFSDDRGFFCEVMKFGEDAFTEIMQTNYTETHPGVIKAFHWHRYQADVWFVVSGTAQVVLHDLRLDSSTFRQTDVFYMGENNRLLLLIPPGVAHGYQVLGEKSVKLFYHASRVYDPDVSDEERIAFNDPGIGFDWEVKNR